MTHGNHMFKIASDITLETIRAYTIKICITTLETCFAVFYKMAKYLSYKYIIRLAKFQYYSNNKFSCASPTFTLYRACQTPFQQK